MPKLGACAASSSVVRRHLCGPLEERVADAEERTGGLDDQREADLAGALVRVVRVGADDALRRGEAGLLGGLEQSELVERAVDDGGIGGVRFARAAPGRRGARRWRQERRRCCRETNAYSPAVTISSSRRANPLTESRGFGASSRSSLHRDQWVRAGRSVATVDTRYPAACRARHAASVERASASVTSARSGRARTLTRRACHRGPAPQAVGTVTRLRYRFFAGTVTATSRPALNSNGDSQARNRGQSPRKRASGRW